MRVCVSPAARMVRAVPDSLSPKARERVEKVIAVYSCGGGLLSIGRFLDMVAEQPKLVLCPSPDLLSHLRSVLRDETKRVATIAECEHELMPFQEEGTAFLWRNRGALLTDEQGLGKTVQVLAAIEPHRPALVFCPAILRENWAAECRKWRPDIEPYIVEGRIRNDVPQPGELWIASYGSLPEDVHAMQTFYPGTHLVADEGQFLRNFSAQRTKTFRMLARRVRQSGFVWILTGTPVVNEPDELWALLQACGIANEIYDGRDSFDKLWGGYRSISGVCWGKPKPEAIERLRPFYLRRNRLEVLPQLPGKIYSDIEIDVKFNKDEAAVLKQVLAEYGVQLERGELDKMLSTNVSTARRVLSKAKLPAVLEFAKSIDRPLVVFTCFRDTAKAFGANKGWLQITGETKDRDRQYAVQQMQAGKLRGLACTIATAGTGLTLTKSHDAIFVDQAYTEAENEQAEDRLCRIGQDDTVQITRFVARHALDKRVAAILRTKRELAAPTKWTNTSAIPYVPALRLAEFIEHMEKKK